MVLALLGVLSMSVAATPPQDHRLDLLDAMVAELDRSKRSLSLKENAGPYFISYHLKEFDQRELSARYGALFEDSAQRDRRLFVDVRVGDYAFDSSVGEALDFSFSSKGPSYVARKSAPVDDSPEALRTALWLITDEKYKAALFTFLKKKGEAVYAVDDPRRPPSFAKQDPVVEIARPIPFGFARDRWAPLVRALSSRLAKEPDLFDSEVRITADKVLRVVANSEGTRLVTEQTLYGLHVTANTRAADGQLLENARDWYAPVEARLPTDEAIRAAVEELVSELLALRVAPTLEPYTGPALLEPDAAGVLFHEAVGHRLEGDRQDDGGDGKTFRGQVGKVVLPTFLSLTDDPTLVERGGVLLSGHYDFDDEAVPAQQVTLVKNGVLQAFLLSRKPVEGWQRSNGHGRAQGTRRPVARMATLIVEANKRVSLAELKRQLLAEAKRQGKPYALVIRDIAGGNTNTAGSGFQAFKGSPRMVFRVDVATGKETLVRGVEIVGTPLTSINKVLAAGATEGVFNGYCGAESGMVPVSTIAPAIVLQELELQRTLDGRDRPPILPSPATLE